MQVNKTCITLLQRVHYTTPLQKLQCDNYSVAAPTHKIIVKFLNEY